MVDKNNKFVVPCTYTYLNDRLNDNGLIAVISGNKMGWINLQAKVIVPLEYDAEIDIYGDDMSTVIMTIHQKENFYVDMYGNRILVK